MWNGMARTEVEVEIYIFAHFIRLHNVFPIQPLLSHSFTGSAAHVLLLTVSS